MNDNDTASPQWLTSEYWQRRFESDDTPWELGHPSVVLLEGFDLLARTGRPLTGMSVLSPGCGRGSDALALVQLGAHVVAVDWSPLPLQEMHERYLKIAPSVGALEVLAGDFFEVPPRQVDCVAEHTFFCAIDPATRPRYVQRIAEWLRPGSYVVGNFFVLSDAIAAALPGLSLTQLGEGPPFATTVAELEKLFSPYFTTIVLQHGSQQEPERRPGMEWVGIFKRK
jgi:SAM-dependent methyltransferase